MSSPIVDGIVLSVFALAISAQDNVRLNEIQVIGTHNSYHAGIPPSEAKVFAKRNPKAYDTLDYRHAPLDAQLAAGVRQIELDVWSDVKGGLFAHPMGPKLVAEAGLPADAPYTPDLSKPGFKVLHMQDVDYRSTCTTLVECLQVVKKWSKAHPGHVPIFILVESKQERPKSAVLVTKPEPFTAETYDALDKEIRSVFSDDEMITPDLVRGKHETLNEAIRKEGWPKLKDVRGRVMFLMDQDSAGPLYLPGHPSLRGRVIFTNGVPGHADAAFVKANEASEAELAKLVREGYLVRSRSDAETRQARSGDGSRRDAVLRSGAQMVSTDYPASEPSRWTGYKVELPGGVAARCNPVLRPKGCVDAELDQAR